MDDEFKDLQCLLRLKRYEAPPQEYFEDFLVEFHHRQRAELLKRPLWRLIVDRIEGALPTVPVSRYAYASACATAVVAAVLASGHILHTVPVESAGTLASVGPSLTALPAPASSFHIPSPAVSVRSNLARVNILSNKQSFRISPELDFDRPRPAVVSYANSRPRYVLDTQPVSYEQPYHF